MQVNSFATSLGIEVTDNRGFYKVRRNGQELIGFYDLKRARQWVLDYLQEIQKL